MAIVKWIGVGLVFSGEFNPFKGLFPKNAAIRKFKIVYALK